MFAESKRFAFTGPIYFFFLLCQGNQAWRLDVKHAKGVQCGAQLSFPPVDQKNVRKHIFFVAEPAETAGNDFTHGSEIIDAFNGLNLEAAVARLERQAVDEGDQ